MNLIVKKVAVLGSGVMGSQIAAHCINWCMGEVGNIRIDTHKQNIPMQKVIAKCEFIYCGIVFMQNGDERIAFQKLG